MTNFDLKPIEVKKIYSAAKKANKGKLPEVTGWFTNGEEDCGFIRVDCEICDGLTGERLNDVTIYCCMFNHKKSYTI